MDRKWALLDPGGRTLYQTYVPEMRILPGNRFAFNNDDDPYQMITSLQNDEDMQQVDSYLQRFDTSILPMDEESGISLAQQAYVIGHSPSYQAMEQMAAETGLKVLLSFDCDYDKDLPKARGHFILIETHRGKPELPKIKCYPRR